MQISFYFCKTCICLKILGNMHISVNMIDKLDITDEYLVKCVLSWIFLFIDAALKGSLRKVWKCNVLWFYLFGQGVPNENKGTINLKYSSTKVFHTVMILNFRTDTPGQTVQTQIRVYTVCHSVCILWTHYSMVEPHSSNFRVITTNFLGVRIFRKFTVCSYNCFTFQWSITDLFSTIKSV